MDESRFKIVFEKLSQAIGKQDWLCEFPPESESMRAELEEISELRRLALEITDPEPMSYTTT